MTTELAKTIRLLRLEHSVSYSDLGCYLSESNPDSGASFGIGKALTDLAATCLHDNDSSWT